jgi:hypothetical protein
MREGYAGNFRFCPKNSGLRNFCKLHAINAKHSLGYFRKNVLTARMGLFLGLLAGKQGLCAKENAFYFAFFHVLMVFCVYKLLSVKIFQNIFACKINRAKKPTVGFWFLAGSANVI